MSFAPPWLRLVPWLLALILALGFWALWERNGRLGDKLDTVTSERNAAQATLKQERKERAFAAGELAASRTERDKAQSNLRRTIKTLEKLRNEKDDCVAAPVHRELDERLCAAALAAGGQCLPAGATHAPAED